METAGGSAFLHAGCVRGNKRHFAMEMGVWKVGGGRWGWADGGVGETFK